MVYVRFSNFLPLLCEDEKERITAPVSKKIAQHNLPKMAKNA